jgi:Cohesin domain
MAQFITATKMNAATPVSVTINGPAQVNTGSNFSVTVDISQVSNFYGVQFDLRYDSMILQYVSTAWGQIGSTQISGNGTTQSAAVAGGRRFLLSLNNLSSGISGTGTIVTIQFNVIGTTQQTASFNLANGIISDFNANAIAASWTGSSVTIVATQGGNITTTSQSATTTPTTTMISTTPTATTPTQTSPITTIGTTITTTTPITTSATSINTTTKASTIVTPTTSAITTQTTTPTTTPVVTTTGAVTGTGTVNVSNDVTTNGQFIAPVSLTSDDNKATINIPAGTSGTMPDGTLLSSVTVALVSDPPPLPPTGESIISIPYEFGPSGAIFSSPITMTFSYNPSLVPTGSTPCVAWYNPATGQWEQLTAVSIDSVNHTIAVSVNHFSIFAVMIIVTNTTQSPRNSNIAIIIGIMAVFFVEIGSVVVLLMRIRKGSKIKS